MRRRRGGYLLAPVALLLVTVAAVAFLMSFEGALGTRMLGGEAEADAAGYVARAGLEHALWQLGESECGGDFALAATPLGQDSYVATVAAGGTTTAYSLGTDQDAWIRSDDTDKNNNGTDQHIRFEGGNVEHALFRFDVATLPAGARVNTASGWFYVKGGGEHLEGPITVHRVTTDWTETGVTWDSLGGGFDAQILDTIPAQGAGDVWVRVNLTAQVQAWVNGGEPNYGVLLASSAEGVHAKYVSREGGQQPWLEVVIGSGPPSPANVQATGTLASGTSRTLTRAAASRQPASTLRLRPDGSQGKDAYLWEANMSSNYGGDDQARVGEGTGNQAVALFEFDVSQIPGGAVITAATLSLYLESGQGATVSVPAYRVTNSWSETIASWFWRQFFVPWGTPGGDVDGAAVATTDVGPATGTRYEWDLTGLVRGWVDGSHPNHGVAIGPAASTGELFATSDHADPTRHPRLTLEYACECGTPCLSPQGSGNVMMVVGTSVWNLSDGDDAVRDLLEAWGYNVNLIQDDDSQGNFDAGVASNDVVLVSGSVSDTNVGTKLTSAPIGVVSAKGELNDELGIASSSGSPTGSTLDVVDAAHFITAIFPAGALDFKSAPMLLQTLSGSLAPDAQELAQASGSSSLVALEEGASLEGGGSAAGRRAFVPVGEGVFDPRLTGAGRLILQRSLAWGSGLDMEAGFGPGLWLSTLNDVSGSGAPGLDDWSEGEVLEFGHPGLVLGAFTTEGTFRSVFDLDAFAADGNADIDAIHYVGSDITVGGANSVDLRTGDLLFSTAHDEFLGGESLDVVFEDVVLFRPDAAGDYSAGSFSLLVDGLQLPIDNLVGVSLVERDTDVGDGSLSAGWFLLGLQNRRDVVVFRTEDVGLLTTSGPLGEFIDGPSLGFGSELRGLDLVEEAVTIGGHPLHAGAILATLNNDVPSDADGVGSNGLKPQSEDVFYLTVSQVGSSPEATATTLLLGAAVGLDTNDEHLQALSLETALTPAVEPIVLSTDSDASLGGLAFTDRDLAEYDPGLDTATLHFDGGATTLNSNIDALHVLENGHLVLSTKDAATLGGLSFQDGDLIDYDPAIGSASLALDESAFSADEDIVSVYVTSDGHLILSTDSDATLGGLSFTDEDLVEYDPGSDTATIFFDGSATTLNADISAVHVLGNGHIVLSTMDAATLGGLDFADGDLVDYDPVLDSAVLYFDETMFSADEDIRSAHIGPGSGALAAPPGAVSYVERFEPWSATSSDTWQTVDLAGFGVPADAVVEVAITNNKTDRERWGGVRAVGSSLDRRMPLHEAEGGGVDAVTMHVQTDASSRIQHYSDNTGQVTFTLLGYWTGVSYEERFVELAPGGTGSWNTVDLGDEGIAAGTVVEVAVTNTDGGAQGLFGLRQAGSSLPRRVDLHEAEAGGVDVVSMMVQADDTDTASIEVWNGNGSGEFWLLGAFTTPPGSYVEAAGGDVTPSSSSSWETGDFAALGVPASSVAQVVLANQNASAARQTGLRETTGSSPERRLDLHKAESGGDEAVSFHVNIDDGGNAQWYGESTSDSHFYPIGWWVIP